ncbi:hypothetical protein CRG98_023326 [Punica granatum]|uniref:Uncharacterized protein n=1 Tax=Punica granatum TaxID=22663 RepID=A0A2I0JJ78_PUNGR|nr:hypothetical protein CRG98_023326 [Punica granatum]
MKDSGRRHGGQPARSWSEVRPPKADPPPWRQCQRPPQYLPLPIIPLWPNTSTRRHNGSIPRRHHRCRVAAATPPSCSNISTQWWPCLEPLRPLSGQLSNLHLIYAGDRRNSEEDR